MRHRRFEHVNGVVDGSLDPHPLAQRALAAIELPAIVTMSFAQGYLVCRFGKSLGDTGPFPVTEILVLVVRPLSQYIGAIIPAVGPSEHFWGDTMLVRAVWMCAMQEQG